MARGVFWVKVRVVGWQPEGGCGTVAGPGGTAATTGAAADGTSARAGICWPTARASSTAASAQRPQRLIISIATSDLISADHWQEQSARARAGADVQPP